MLQEEAARPTFRGRIATLSARWPFLVGLPSAIASWRTRIRVSSIAADIVAVAGAYLATAAIRVYGMPMLGLSATPPSPGWEGIALGVATVSVFYASGLYELECYVSRPLHMWMVLRAALVAFVISAVSIFAFTSGAWREPYLTLLLTFVVFVLFACTLRIGVLDALFRASVRRRGSVSFVLGSSGTTDNLTTRLRTLRGFSDVEQVVPAALRLGMPEALNRMISDRPSHERAAAVFIDASSATPREVFETASLARALGADVYVVSRLLGSLEVNRLLSGLFEAPVVRVRHSIGSAKPYFLKRALDVVVSAGLLAVCLPIIVVLGVAIRLTSPGPVFYTQSRVGRFGVPFEFVKLRSMVLNHDASKHLEYVHAFMNNTAQAMPNGSAGDTVFKLVDDPRITPLGKFLRKYSLDEIPQFWNVLRGDMSMVGPRPPLPYEVSEYDDWHSLRLSVPSGITGLWQVDGRSRVSFDEMILQDVMYAQNMRLLLDLRLCLKTVPAALFGSGGG
jgi:exopolysaccharide biosynthesis polyprenyl glycosylphosphotransferase